MTYDGGRPLAKQLGLTRLELLRGAAAFGVAGSLGGALVGCAGDDDQDEPADASGPPKRGGRLRAGIPGAGKRESFNPALGGENLAIIFRLSTHFDPLVRVIQPGKPEPGLAVEWTPNKDATEWVFELRPDVTWHDGKPFTADDVVYSIRFMGNPKHFASSGLKDVRFDEVKKLDARTVSVPLKRPNTSLPVSLGAIVQDGVTDFTKPVGTGAFKLESFTAGERSLSSRNPDYWDEGKPYADELELISIEDNSARLNALLSGETDVMAQIPATMAAQYQDSDDVNIINASSTSALVFYMRVDTPPFDDVRVRQAMRLLVDREAIVTSALSGLGEIGNDLLGNGLPFFAESIPQRERDVEQAQSLLRQAGHGSDFRVTLETTTGEYTDVATLFKQQAADAGVTVDLQRVPFSAYFDPSLKYLKMPFGQDIWIGDTLSSFYTAGLTSSAPYNTTHWRDRSFDDLVNQAIGTVDDKAAAELWLEIQQVQWDKGGFIVWGHPDVVDALSPTVKGLEPSGLTNLGAGYGLITAWLE